MNISPDQLQTLEEVAKQAAHSASESLSKLIGIPVSLEMLGTREVEVDQLAAILASPEMRVSAIILPIAGEGGGSSALILTLEESRRLAELVTKQPAESTERSRSMAPEEELDAHAVSALKETGNIIGGAFLSALSDMAGVSLVQSVPELVTNTMTGVVNTVAARLPSSDKVQSVALEIDFSLTTTTETIVAHYLFLLDVAFAQKLLEAMQS